MHVLKTCAPDVRSYGFKPDVLCDVGTGSGTPWLCKSIRGARFWRNDPRTACVAKPRAQEDLQKCHSRAMAQNAALRPSAPNRPKEGSVMPGLKGLGLRSDLMALLTDAGLWVRDVTNCGAGTEKNAHPCFMEVLSTRWAI